jgi:predicted nucleotidyltransferase
MATRIDETLIHEIVRRTVAVVHPDRIILFGSAASGRVTDDSDVDLLIRDDAPADPRGAKVRVRQALRGLGVPFDIIVMRTERFEESKEVIGGIAYPAHKYGRVIYEAA